MVRSMMNLTTLSLFFWDYALETATRILNMVLTKKVDKTLYELWYGKVPNFSYLKVWGCEALVKQDMPDKLQQRSVKCIFIGYPKETMGYYFYFPSENKIVVAMMYTSKRGYIPMQERLDLNKTQSASTPEEVKRMQNIPYASAVGSIMYASRDWRISNQSTTAMSATEAEYIVALEVAMEAVWIRKFISGLGIVPTINEPIKMFSDNSAALHFANKTGVQRGARHYHRKYHYVRECIELGEINLRKVHTDDNLADPFTNALSKGKLTC
uniref:Zinc finger, CCHC-type n=1 Tax=Tanacetum cinerariifolium TaxID=118510 RepID=A0A6L2JIE1_TANCI|nr:zinc finger, CCHC-type [Tanacetum cinerariifolium]